MKRTALYVDNYLTHINSQVLHEPSEPTTGSAVDFSLDAGIQIVSGSSATNLDFGFYLYVANNIESQIEDAVLEVQKERAAVKRLLDHVQEFHDAFVRATDDAIAAISAGVVQEDVPAEA